MTEAGLAVLIVDDEPPITSVIRRQVARMGYRPLTATTLIDAVREVEGQDVALLIIDLHLDGTSGTDVVQALRGRGVSAPALFISGDASIEGVEESISAASFFLPKPFTVDELADAIWQALRQR